MKLLKIILKSIYNIVSIPSILIHELLHVLLTYIVGYTINWINSEFVCYLDTGEMYAFVVINEKLTKVKSAIISMAPVLSFLISIILSFISPFFLYVLVYQLITFKYSLPSKTDFEDFLILFK